MQKPEAIDQTVETAKLFIITESLDDYKIKAVEGCSQIVNQPQGISCKNRIKGAAPSDSNYSLPQQQTASVIAEKYRHKLMNHGRFIKELAEPVARVISQISNL